MGSRKASRNAQHIKRLSGGWAIRAESQRGFHFCQLRARIWGYYGLRLREARQLETGKQPGDFSPETVHMIACYSCSLLTWVGCNVAFCCYWPFSSRVDMLCIFCSCTDVFKMWLEVMIPFPAAQRNVAIFSDLSNQQAIYTHRTHSMFFSPLYSV